MNPNPIKNRQLPIYLIVLASMVVVGLFFRLQAGNVSANSGDIQLAENTYPGIVGSRIDTCVLCHTSSIPNLNPYGAAYKAAGRGLASSLHAIENVDSDTDGFTNLQEITALTFPGNAADHPVAPTRTNTPFQPASPTPTQTRTQPAVTSTSTSTRAATTVGATATSTKTAAATSVAPSSVPSATATVRSSRTPTAKPTLKASVVPTCVSDKKDNDDEDDDGRAKLNCSHKPEKGDKEGSDRDDDNHQNNSESEDQDLSFQNSSHLSSSMEDRLSSIPGFLSSLFASLAGKLN